MSEQIAPPVPGLTKKSLAELHQRPGYAMFIPAECLKLGASVWTEEQKERGIWVKGIYLTPTEEEECVVNAGRANKLQAINLFYIRRSLYAVADPMVVDDPEAPDGKRNRPGQWKLIASLEQASYWDELGIKGRNLFTIAYQLANAPSKAAQEVALSSFCEVS